MTPDRLQRFRDCELWDVPVPHPECPDYMHLYYSYTSEKTVIIGMAQDLHSIIAQQGLHPEVSLRSAT